MIVAVYWTPQDLVREYSIMKKSDADENYGSLLEEVNYKGNQLVEVKD